MRKFLSLITLVIITKISYSQNFTSGIVLDKNTFQPIEFVDVYNENDNTFTNEQGRFEFTSINDSIVFQVLGYNEFRTAFKNISNNDTIFLKSKVYALNEVLVTNENTIFKKMIKALEINYPSSSFNENFFLRCLLKRNSNIVKLQDIQGTIARNTLISTSKAPITKDNYEVYVNQMRKAGVIKDEIDFELFDFDTLLNSIVTLNMSPKKYLLKERYLNDSTLVKLTFRPKSNETNTEGYYLINTSDYAFNEVVIVTDDINAEFSENGKVKYRTIKYYLHVKFYKNPTLSQYLLENAKLNYVVEVYNKKNERIVYDVDYILKTYNSENIEIIKKNKVSTTKNIFNLKQDYNKEYWEKANQLMLTDEMVDFLKSLEFINSNYKISTNLHKNSI